MITFTLQTELRTFSGMWCDWESHTLLRISEPSLVTPTFCKTYRQLVWLSIHIRLFTCEKSDDMKKKIFSLAKLNSGFESKIALYAEVSPQCDLLCISIPYIHNFAAITAGRTLFSQGEVDPTIIHSKRYSCLQALNGVLNYVVNIEW